MQTELELALDAIGIGIAGAMAYGAIWLMTRMQAAEDWQAALRRMRKLNERGHGVIELVFMLAGLVLLVVVVAAVATLIAYAISRH